MSALGIIAGSFASKLFAETARSNAGAYKSMTLSERPSTILTSADVVVLGASLAGLALAVLAARMNRKVMLIDAGPVLGTEISGQWDMHVPEGWLADELAELCRPQGGYADGRFDPFITTLACDRLAQSAGVTSLVCALPIRPIAGAGGMLHGVEIVGKSGRQLIAAPRIIDTTAGNVFSYRACGLNIPIATAVTRRMYLYGISCNAPKRISVSGSLGVAADSIEVQPTLWPDEVIVSYSMQTNSAMSRIALGAMSYHAGFLIMQHLHKEHSEFEKSLLVDIAPEIKITYPAVEPDVLRVIENTGVVQIDAGKAVTDKQWAMDHLKNVLSKTIRPFPVGTAVTMTGHTVTSELSAAVEQGFSRTVLPPVRAVIHEHSDVVVAGCGCGGAFAALAAGGEGGACHHARYYRHPRRNRHCGKAARLLSRHQCRSSEGH
ncbi:MAG: FAD-dependent oxidoreductase [Spirochaetota bacterium]